MQISKESGRLYRFALSGRERATEQQTAQRRPAEPVRDQGRSTSDRLVAALSYAAEIAVLIPADLVTVKIRDAVVPRAVKKMLPFLSCRRISFSIRS